MRDDAWVDKFTELLSNFDDASLRAASYRYAIDDYNYAREEAKKALISFASGVDVAECEKVDAIDAYIRAHYWVCRFSVLDDKFEVFGNRFHGRPTRADLDKLKKLLVEWVWKIMTG